MILSPWRKFVPLLLSASIFLFVLQSLFLLQPALAHDLLPAPPPTGPAGQSANEQVEKLKDIRKKIEETQNLLEETKKKKATLQNEIIYQNNQIELTALKIQETEQQIEALSNQINRLEGVLVNLSDVFAKRAVETYILKRVGDPVVLFLTSKNVSEFISQFRYLKRIQENDKQLLLQVQSTQTSFEDKRAEEEALQKKLEAQNKELERQKVQKHLSAKKYKNRIFWRQPKTMRKNTRNF
ncbi:MAG: hypothetical protein HYS83_02415 [Candidatus Blackburnbacteria bacterium]|nr:hypothetical protein [Candidatus Blackburnbacteria bacterium]